MKQILLSVLIFAPMLGVLGLIFVPKKKNRLVLQIGIGATLPSLLLVIYLFIAQQMGTDFESFNVVADWFRFSNLNPADYGKIFAVDYELTLDGLAYVMLALTVVISSLAAFASCWIEKERKGYFMLLLTLEMGLLGLFLAGNMFLFFLFFEVTLVTTFFLVGKWGGEQKEKAAFRFLIYNGIGSAILLFVIMMLEARLGTTNIEILSMVLPQKGIEFPAPVSDTMRMVLFLCVLVAFLIKLPSFPMHSWMLKMHTQAPIPIVMIHAGILLKIGAYGIIRFGMNLFPDQFLQVAHYLIWIGVFNLLYGAFLALVQTELRSLLAYSSVSHMGFVLMGLGALNETGIQGAITQVVSHGLISALLFFVVGVLYKRVKTTEIAQLGGLSKPMPYLSGFLLLGGLAVVGVPGFSAFVSELLVYIGLFQTHRLLASIASISIILTTLYFLKAILKMNYGELKLPSENVRLKDLTLAEWIPATILLIAIVFIGVMPHVLNHQIQDVVAAIMNGMGV